MANKKYIEKGDIYIFFRNKVDIEKASSIDDIQRTYLVLVPDKKTKGRTFIVGRKKLPDVIEGKSKSTERNWMMNAVTSKPKKLREDLGAIQYKTKTKGERDQGEAMPAAAGRYIIFNKSDGTQLAYRIQQPKKLGKAQKELGILPEASYLIYIRNPDIEVKGFPEDNAKYPKYLKEKFVDERWISISNPKLLDVENGQLVLIGAHKNLDDLDIKITGKANLFKTLGIKEKKWQTDTLVSGEFASPKFKEELREPTSDPTKGGKSGGKKSEETASAVGVAKALQGTEFPRKQKELVNYAVSHGANNNVIELLKMLPKRRKYENMADVEKAVGKVR